MSWCGLGEVYSNWGSITFLNIWVCVFGSLLPLFEYFQPGPLLSCNSKDEKVRSQRSPRLPGLLDFPSASVLRGVQGVVYLQVHKFFLLSSPFRCWAHRPGFFLSLLYFHFRNFHFLPSSISLLRFLSFPLSSHAFCAGGFDLSVGWPCRLLRRMVLPLLTSLAFSLSV